MSYDGKPLAWLEAREIEVNTNSGVIAKKPFQEIIDGDSVAADLEGAREALKSRIMLTVLRDEFLKDGPAEVQATIAELMFEAHVQIDSMVFYDKFHDLKHCPRIEIIKKPLILESKLSEWLQGKTVKLPLDNGGNDEWTIQRCALVDLLAKIPYVLVTRTGQIGAKQKLTPLHQVLQNIPLVDTTRM